MESTENNQDMKKPVEIWQLIIAVVAVFISLVTLTSMMNTSMREDAAKQASTTENLKVRVGQLEQDRAETKEDIKDIKKDNREILLILKDKADRK